MVDHVYNYFDFLHDHHSALFKIRVLDRSNVKLKLITMVLKLYELKITYMNVYKGILTKIQYYGLQDHQEDLENCREILKQLDLDYVELENDFAKMNPKI